MKAVSQTLLLCMVLLAPTAHAEGDSVAPSPAIRGKRLTLLDEASPLTQTAEVQHGNLAAEAMAGLAGAFLLIPGGSLGAVVGDRLSPAPSYCDSAGCDYGFPLGAAVGLLTGGTLGFVGGTGLGVAFGGRALGGEFNWLPAVSGAAFGGLMGALVCIPVDFGLQVLRPAGDMTMLWIYGATAAILMTGTITGAVWAYEGSRPWLHRSSQRDSGPELRATPVVTLVPGGGAVGVAGTFGP